MGAIELRDKIMQLISTDNVNYLKDIFAFAEQKKIEEEKGVVAYTVEGEPLTKEMYIKKVKDADASIKTGQFVTSEELEKQMRSW